ncbi:hypothetical protein LH67_19855, partial [Xenorhabdus nematophila]
RRCHRKPIGICERFHKTILNEFYQVTFRKKLYGSLDELQKDLDKWMDNYNNHRTHQGKNVLRPDTNRNPSGWEIHLGRKKI